MKDIMKGATRDIIKEFMKERLMEDIIKGVVKDYETCTIAIYILTNSY